MKEISYIRVDSISSALEASMRNPGAMYLAGGTNVVDLLRGGVYTPDVVVDITNLPLREIQVGEDWTRIGAMVPNSELGWNPTMLERYPALSQALLSGGGGQIRNMATTGGNLLQRTRCPYFRDVAAACNKRTPGAGCAALNGFNRSHAVLGASEHCIAAHPSDFSVALTALEARVVTIGPDGGREIPISDFYLEPGDRPDRETVLHPGELILAIELPFPAAKRHSLYLKVGDPQAFDFALASAAVAADFAAGALRNVRLALGGVGTVPWRPLAAEALLEGQIASETLFSAAAEAALEGAQALRHNAFKVPLAKRVLISALTRFAKRE